jgi:Pao retrotransposon peptidase
MLLIFGDGSREAYATLAYIRWVLTDGTVECKLLTGMTRVAPKQKISIPRMELMGALLVVRLARKIRDTFTFKFKATRYFTDSSAILGMLKCDSASFLEFVGTRVSEIKSLSSPEEEWFWIPTDCNLADLGTRPNVEPGDLAEDSYYQNGQPWMMKPESEWPTKKRFSAPPAEERRKDVVTVASALSATAPGTKFKSLAKLVNTYAYVFQAIKRWKTYRVDPVRMEQRLEPPPPEAMEAAMLYLIQESQKEINMKDIESFLPEVNLVRDQYGYERKIIMVGSRGRVVFRVGYDALGVPVLP